MAWSQWIRFQFRHPQRSHGMNMQPRWEMEIKVPEWVWKYGVGDGWGVSWCTLDMHVRTYEYSQEQSIQVTTASKPHRIFVSIWKSFLTLDDHGINLQLSHDQTPLVTRWRMDHLTFAASCCPIKRVGFTIAKETGEAYGDLKWYHITTSEGCHLNQQQASSAKFLNEKILETKLDMAQTDWQPPKMNLPTKKLWILQSFLVLKDFSAISTSCKIWSITNIRVTKSQTSRCEKRPLGEPSSSNSFKDEKVILVSVCMLLLSLSLSPSPSLWLWLWLWLWLLLLLLLLLLVLVLVLLLLLLTLTLTLLLLLLLLLTLTLTLTLTLLLLLLLLLLTLKKKNKQ